MREGDWEQWERRLVRAWEQTPISLAEAARIYAEVPEEPLDEVTIRRLARAASARWSRREGGGGSHRVRPAGVWLITDGPVSRHMVGWVDRRGEERVSSHITRIVRTPSDVVLVVDSQMVSGRDVAEAMESGRWAAVSEVGAGDDGLGSVCIDSHVDAARAWVVDTSQTTLRELVAADCDLRPWERRAG